jgi:SpoVK/Ycf46/Vps4 family AAA+-type ATPase
VDVPSFLKNAGRILNAGTARTLVVSGNIHDLFYSRRRSSYESLVGLLADEWSDHAIVVCYEPNGLIRFVKPEQEHLIADAWKRFRLGATDRDLAIRRVAHREKTSYEEREAAEDFTTKLRAAGGKPAVALELLRQLCLMSRSILDGEPLLDERLIIIVENADMLIPTGEISRLSDSDRHRIGKCADWFSDLEFLRATDSVVLISESRSQLNERVARLPQLLEVEIPSPARDERLRFTTWFRENHLTGASLRLWASDEALADLTAALSLHALRQLLIDACHTGNTLAPADVVAKVEEFIQGQLGPDVVEFKKPEHRLSDVVGFSKLKEFISSKLIPRIMMDGKSALPGAAVAGAIGAGKTFIFEAVAAEVGIPVIVLKNLRSKWFGETDVIFERLRRVLYALAKVLIFVDEADTQIGGVGPEAHTTERRLTGKIQGMMSDPKLLGRVSWLLMTARIHLLSPDIRRPGRVGSLIIPVLDPEGEDRVEFLHWVIEPISTEEMPKELICELDGATAGYSAAGFAALRSELIAEKQLKGGSLEKDEITKIVHDHLPPPIGETRRYQTLQALLNCTNRQLLPDGTGVENRGMWEAEIRKLELQGIN